MKRHASLTALARDHHHALVFALSLRRDAPERLRAHLSGGLEEQVAQVRSRFARELEPHFRIEERVLLPAGDAAGGALVELGDQVRREHAELRRLVAELRPDSGLPGQLDAFGRALTEHVRFEDRAWFVALERDLDPAQLQELGRRLQVVPEPALVGFEQDAEGDWVALLDCGHRQHVRHRPPWQDRAWVTTEAGRQSQLGTRLPCLWCRMPTLPPGAVEYKSTSSFDEHTVPVGLTRSHRLRAGVWGQVVVTEGRVLYVLEDDDNLGFMLDEAHVGVVAPERPHHVQPQPGARFHLRFLREPAAD